MNNISKEEADKKLFDNIAKKYLKKDIIPYSKRSRILRLKRTLRHIKKPIGSIFEIGCGCGFSATYLKNDYNDFIGLDYSEELINYANRYNKYPNAKFISQNIKNYTSDEKYEVIFMIGVLHHIVDAEKVLNDIKNLLTKDGYVIVNEPQRGNPIIKIMRKIRKKIDKNYSSDQVEFSEGELIALFNKCGYKTKAYPQGFFSTPFAETSIFPNIIGNPLSMLSCWLDPIFEKIFQYGLLRKLAWNTIIEAKKI